MSRSIELIGLKKYGNKKAHSLAMGGYVLLYQKDNRLEWESIITIS